VLIYFDVQTKKNILANVRKILPHWGYLFLGGAETTINLGDMFERLQIERAGCYRVRQA
jgi:chemotaxis protein methyltransferase CheR